MSLDYKNIASEIVLKNDFKMLLLKLPLKKSY
jgi:hypothetical protein